jgi:predicted dehydrogenase
MNHNCLLLGAGNMAMEYAKVLQALQVNFLVIGRSKKGVDELLAKFTVDAVHGGLAEHSKSFKAALPEFAIVAVSNEELTAVTLELIDLGIKNILVEKPAGLNYDAVLLLKKRSEEAGVRLFVAYNRRFYASVNYLKERIAAEGGIASVSFEFTEWVHTFDINQYPAEVLSRLLIVNSSHVLDTVFHLAGRPRELHAHITGNAVEWHSAGSIFTGSGVTEKNVPFSYASNWGAPGRWAIEITTAERRYYLKPLERLAVQEKGSVQVNELEADYSKDIDFKPGLLELNKAFFAKDASILCTIEEHLLNFTFYEQIGNYKS